LTLRASTSAGPALGLASAALFGASTPLAKLLLGEVDPWLLAGLLYLGSGIGLGAMHLGRRFLGIEPSEAPLRRADLPWLAAVILAGGESWHTGQDRLSYVSGNRYHRLP